MNLKDTKLDEIPQGDAASFKRGVSDGIINGNNFIDSLKDGDVPSYKKGVELGKMLQEIISMKMK